MWCKSLQPCTQGHTHPVAVAVSGGNGVHAYGIPHQSICTPAQGHLHGAPVHHVHQLQNVNVHVAPLVSARTSRSVDTHHTCTRPWQAPKGLLTRVDRDVSQCVQHGQVLEGALLQRRDGVVVHMSARAAPTHSNTVRYTHTWATPTRPAATMHTDPRDLSLMTHCAHARRRLRT